MKKFLTVLNFLTLSIGSFGQSDSAPDFPGGLLSEAFNLITNGTVEHFVGCKSYDNITEDDIAYYLYTRKSRNRITLTRDNLYEFDSTKDVKIIFGGWLQSTNDSILSDIMDAYLTRYDCNVIFPEIINLTNTQYTQAYCNIIKGSEMVGDFLYYMFNEGCLNFNNVHMVGVSLGGHMAGLVGQIVQERCNQKVDRITGLDPAGPIYQYQDISMRLDKSDANFVDVIHTNIGLSGYYKSMGHVDFYPNCGSIQPGCMKFDSYPDILDMIVSLFQCSHNRSMQLFIESIYGPVFNATNCSICSIKGIIRKCKLKILSETKYAIMGEDCPRNPPAKNFYIKTNSKSPYAKVK